MDQAIDLEATMVRAPVAKPELRHWKLTRESDGLAVLVFDKAGASANSLSAEALAEFNRALDELDRARPRALLIRSGKASGFIAGADIDEFGAITTEEGATALVKRGYDAFERLAAVPYPTLALVRGFCLGGGLELALACRYRVAVDEPGTRMGLPEVLLGIVPGWGGITRLPRVVGAPAALDLMLTGKAVDARRAKKLGLVDEAVPPRIMENTARGMLAALPPPRKLPFALGLTLNPIARRLIAAKAAKEVAKRARREHYPAPYAILDLFARHDGNALAPPAGDPASLVTLFRSPTAQNLVRVFRLQERLKSIGKEADAGAAHVHVVGAGTMGGDIAAWCALRGLTVTLQDQSPERIAPAIARAAKLCGERLKDARRVRDAMDRLIPDVAGEGAARADVIVEAIFENVDAKRAVFAALEKKAKPGAILATNTSSIPLESIASALADPSRLIGLHFFNPAPLMPLVEVVRGLATDPAVADTLFATAAAWGKTPVHAASTPGFIVNRCARPFYGEALRLLAERAAEPATIDAVMREAGGFRMGPFELMDLIGHDVNYAVTRSVWEATFHDPRYAPSGLQRELVAAGRLGRKSGRGFYDHSPGAAPPAPATLPRADAVPRVAIHGEPGPLKPLVARMAAAGIVVQKRPMHSLFPDGAIDAGAAWVALTDGRTASARAAATGASNLVLLDLALDYATAKRLAISASDTCAREAVDAAVGVLQHAGLAVSRLDDVAGLAVMRTVAMLVNEAADAAMQGIATASDIDLAMQKGVNYPRGPLAWGDAAGAARIGAVMANLSAHYGEDRYRVSPRLARAAQTGARLSG